ncbi:hypothetical protein DL98DRAFT_620667 [Cadophora sp. DSE1049]|nr:hypothetical protein DL98DRAFT_620667 [Cadophora sp. DSE1049]
MSLREPENQRNGCFNMSPTYIKRKVDIPTFPKFSVLPAELQLQIWQFACLETPYNPNNEEGKLWQGFHVSDEDYIPQERQQVHVLRPIASLPTWKRVKHFKRRRTVDETAIITTNARKTHALHRTCRQSRLALYGTVQSHSSMEYHCQFRH